MDQLTVDEDHLRDRTIIKQMLAEDHDLRPHRDDAHTVNERRSSLQGPR